MTLTLDFEELYKECLVCLLYFMMNKDDHKQRKNIIINIVTAQVVQKLRLEPATKQTIHRRKK